MIKIFENVIVDFCVMVVYYGLFVEINKNEKYYIEYVFLYICICIYRKVFFYILLRRIDKF